jgi:hypothetical protein
MFLLKELSMFVRFECGCKGIIVDGDMDNVDAIIIERCDRDSADELIFHLERQNRPWTDHSEYQLQYYDRISSLLRDGYRYREIKRLLKD